MNSFQTFCARWNNWSLSISCTIFSSFIHIFFNRIFLKKYKIHSDNNCTCITEKHTSFFFFYEDREHPQLMRNALFARLQQCMNIQQLHNEYFQLVLKGNSKQSTNKISHELWTEIFSLNATAYLHTYTLANTVQLLSLFAKFSTCSFSWQMKCEKSVIYYIIWIIY